MAHMILEVSKNDGNGKMTMTKGIDDEWEWDMKRERVNSRVELSFFYSQNLNTFFLIFYSPYPIDGFFKNGNGAHKKM